MALVQVVMSMALFGDEDASMGELEEGLSSKPLAISGSGAGVTIGEF